MRLRYCGSMIMALSFAGTFLLSGCSSSHKYDKRVVGFSGERLKAEKVATVAGETTKYWQWPRLWQLLHEEDGSLARQWRHPQGMDDKSKSSMGPELLLVRDLNNNISYSISYWQRTARVLDVPITLSFYERANSGTPLFKVIFDDETAAGCKNQVVKKGPTRVALTDPRIFDMADWIGITLPVVTTHDC